MGDMGEIPKKGEIIEQSRVGSVHPELGACILSWDRESRVGIVHSAFGKLPSRVQLTSVVHGIVTVRRVYAPNGGHMAFRLKLNGTQLPRNDSTR